MSVLRKVAAFLTAAGIVVSCASCGYNTINALTVDGADIPAGVYIYYANSAYNEATSKLKEEHEDLDTTDEKAVKALSLEGKDVTTWICDNATEQCAEYAVIEKKFDELGLSFDEATQSNLDMMKEYYWSANKDVMVKNGISEDSFDKILTSSYKSEEIFKHYYAIGGENGTTEEEVYKYYKDNNIRCEYLSMSLKDGEGNLLKSDGKKVIMDMAKAYQKRVEKALKSGGEDAVDLEMKQIREEYQAYVDSLTATEDETTETAADAETTEADTDAETTEADTDAETTEADTDADTTEASDEEETTEKPDSAAMNAKRTDEETTEGETSDEETTEGETSDEETTEGETSDEETTEGETSDEETTEGETSDEETDADADEESGEEENIHENESIISVIDESSYDDPKDIYYNPTEDVYRKLLSIDAKDYGRAFIVEEDEYYYLVIRYDIENRMKENDLWTESTMNDTVYKMFDKTYEEQRKTWADSAVVQRNDAAYKRYDPFKFDFA